MPTTSSQWTMLLFIVVFCIAFPLYAVLHSERRYRTIPPLRWDRWAYLRLGVVSAVFFAIFCYGFPWPLAGVLAIWAFVGGAVLLRRLTGPSVATEPAHASVAPGDPNDNAAAH